MGQHRQLRRAGDVRRFINEIQLWVAGLQRTLSGFAETRLASLHPRIEEDFESAQRIHQLMANDMCPVFGFL